MFLWRLLVVKSPDAWLIVIFLLNFDSEFFGEWMQDRSLGELRHRATFRKAEY